MFDTMDLGKRWHNYQNLDRVSTGVVNIMALVPHLKMTHWFLCIIAFVNPTKWWFRLTIIVNYSPNWGCLLLTDIVLKWEGLGLSANPR